jgi:hypothetical protein
MEQSSIVKIKGSRKTFFKAFLLTYSFTYQEPTIKHCCISKKINSKQDEKYKKGILSMGIQAKG